MPRRKKPNKHNLKHRKRSSKPLPPCKSFWHRYNGTCQKDKNTSVCKWCDGGQTQAFYRGLA